MSRPVSGDLASSPEQLGLIIAALRGYRRLPFAGENIPGAYVEAVIARMRDATVLRTYDFVDVIDRAAGIGWQVKSTLLQTPVTWKRAKIPGQQALVDASRTGDRQALRQLGDAIIDFCNEHAVESLNLYGLKRIGYARVLVTASEIIYFERELISRSKPVLFDKQDFEWRWSAPKRAVKKEQLPALHGWNVSTDTKWFAWHGLGENQLHFSGESHWWPTATEPGRVSVPLPDDGIKISFEDFVEWVASQELTIESDE